MIPLLTLPLFPKEASTIAPGVDHLFLFLTGIALFFSTLIFLLIAIFAVKFRRKSPDEVGADIHGSLKLEITWTVIPLLLTMVMFFWGAKLFFTVYRPPDDSMDIYVVGKQWMWKIQHPEGKREIDELHVPVGRPVRLIMTSMDVIHDFFIPDFRVKRDVVPGRYTTYGFTPSRIGRYRFFCAQYCGTYHSSMIGWVDVMSAEDYQKWLNQDNAVLTMAQQGRILFDKFNCASCHEAGGSGKGPLLDNLYGSSVRLADGRTATADDAYLRQSILTPSSQAIAGYTRTMPTYQGQMSESQVLELIAYIKSLTPQTVKAAQ